MNSEFRIQNDYRCGGSEEFIAAVITALEELTDA